MEFGLRFRDWLLANDPAFSRLRQAARVTLTILLSVAALFAIHAFIVPLPPAAYALGVVLSIQGGLSVRDRLPSEQMKTRLLGCLVSVVLAGVAAGLENHRYLSDGIFLLVIFIAVYGRAFGQRWFAVGMFAVMSYFMGAYLRPTLEQIPFMAIGAVVSALMAHLIRVYLFPDDWRWDLLRALESVVGRVDQILSALLEISGKAEWTDKDRAELYRLEDRLKEAVLMADSFVPSSGGDMLPEAGQPGAETAIRLFDLHLAAESAIVVSLQSMPSAALLSALMRYDDHAAERAAGGHESFEDGQRSETVRALLWLRDARAAVRQSVSYGRATGFSGFEGPDAKLPVSRIPRLSLSDPALRMAVQITLASGIAMVFGLMLSRERWFWAVLSAFLVFTNTNSRGDTAIKALQRSIGTLLGIGCGMLIALVISGHAAIAGVIAVVCIFAAFYSLQVSYAAMTFFISIVICLVYSMTGVLTLDVLRLRVEETMIGAIAGTAVAFFVLPVRTQSALESALGKWFDALRALLAAADGKAGETAGEVRDLIGLSRRLDAAYRDVVTASRPMGVSWQLVTRPGHVRQTLALFMACTYWARIFASRMTYSSGEVDDGIRAKIGESLARIGPVAARGAACFFVKRRMPKTAGQHLPLSRGGSRLGIEMIDATLDRLYP